MTVGIERGIGCNFCNRSKLGATGFSLIYPYDFVYTIERTNASGVKVNICEDCIKELFTKTMTKL